MLSICINVKNGERYLARCLTSLARFEDVVLLDNYSTDTTLAIAQQYSNVRIFSCEFMGMGKVRNLVASYARQPWVLFVDSDEVLAPALVEQLLSFKFERGYIYQILRQNYYAGKLIDTSWGNDWVNRLYHREDTRFAEQQVHEDLADKLPKLKLQGGVILHFPYAQVSELVNKMQFYSTLFAQQHVGKRKLGLWLIPWRALFMFFKMYVLKRGFLSGYEGFVISTYNALGVLTKYLKLYEANFACQFALAVSLPSITQVAELARVVNRQRLLSEAIIIHVANSGAVLTAAELNLIEQQFVMPVLVVSGDLECELTNCLATYPYIVECSRWQALSDVNYLLKVRKQLQSGTNMPEVRVFRHA